jgi:pimeloyl-ACP methyl ester carboxylesterase
MPEPYHFDTFLSHNDTDKPLARAVGQALKERNLRVWLDEWEQIPGRPWMEAIEAIISSTKSALVLVGSSGIGPWEQPEMRACITQFVKRRIPVIPILLPGAAVQPELPLFLSQFTWVDLRHGLTKEGLDKLVWGITGEKPAPELRSPSASEPIKVETSTDALNSMVSIREEDAEEGKTVQFSVVFSGIINDTDRPIVDGLLAQLRDIARDGRLTLIRIERGSTRFILQASLAGFRRIHASYRSGQMTNSLGYNKPEAVRRHKLLLLIHGIRTRAEWQSRLRALVEEGHDVTVVNIMYGYFDVLRFWLPIFGAREAAINDLKRSVRDALRVNGRTNPEVLVICHSFGTYAITRILREEPDIEIDRLLLSGSIVPRTFKWESLPNCPSHVLNDVGTKDIWPVLAKAASWGYGITGTFGFGAPRVRDRFHALGHSDIFSEQFMRRYWLPWIRDDDIVMSEYEVQRPTVPLLLSIGEFIPLRWVISASFAFGVFQAGIIAVKLLEPIIRMLLGVP